MRDPVIRLRLALEQAIEAIENPEIVVNRGELVASLSQVWRETRTATPRPSDEPREGASDAR